MSGELSNGNRSRDAVDASKGFNIVGSTDIDSEGTSAWAKYFQTDKLRDAWLTFDESAYRGFCKTNLIDSVVGQVNKICCRYSEGEERSERGIGNLVRTGELAETTAVILDSGGAHSVAMAVALMKVGYQPVIMFGNEPFVNGSNRCEQSLATLLYFAEEARKLKEQGSYNASSPPVFIMDTHRSDRPFGTESKDNSYEYTAKDLPSATVLSKHGIKKVMYLNEGDQNGLIQADFQSTDRLPKDLKPIVASYAAAGLDVKYTGVAPRDHSHDRLSFSNFSFRF